VVSEKSPLAEFFQKLSEDAAVKRENLYASLSPELRHVWGVADESSAYRAVSQKIREAILAFTPKTQGPDVCRRWLMVAYNLPGEFTGEEPSNRKQRRDWFNELGSQTRPTFNVSLRTDTRWVADFSEYLARALESRLLELNLSQGQATADCEASKINEGDTPESLILPQLQGEEHDQSVEEPSAPPPPLIPTRRSFLGLAVAGVLGGTGVAAYYLSRPDGKAEATHPSSSPSSSGSIKAAAAQDDIRVNAKAIRLKNEGNKTVIPGDFKPDAATQRTFATPGAAYDDENVKKLLQQEGVNYETLVIQAAATGLRASGVRIVNIEVDIKKKTGPLNGTLFLIGPQGADPVTPLALELDKSEPVVVKLIPSTDGFSSPTPGGAFFESDTVSLTKNEDYVFTIQATSMKHYVEFALVFHCIAEGKKTSLTVDNDGKPFRITGNRCDYKQVYVPQGDYSLAVMDYPTCDG
jgi:hypothetical protein